MQPTLTALISYVREVLDDTTPAYLWDDLTLTRYLNNAVEEACLRGRLLKCDYITSPTQCQINVIAGQTDYTLDPILFGIRNARLAGIYCPLTLATLKGMIRNYGDSWWLDYGDTSPSQPEYLITDTAPGNIRLWRTPCQNYTLQLSAWRRPFDSEVMTGPTDVPVYNFARTEELKHWAVYEALSEKDSEKFDQKKALDELSLFEAAFGQRPSQHDLARWADSPPQRPKPVYF